MPTRSVKPSSLRGENGLDDNSELLTEESQTTPEVVLAVTADCGNLDIPGTKASESDPPAAVAVEDSASAEVNHTPVLTPSERKLADRMTRDIARHLGLDGSSRSVRIDV